MRQHNLKVTGSLQINGESVISASQLSTLSASINSKIEGLNPSQIGTGSYTASISPNGTFRVNTSTIITGSLSISSLSGSGINYLAYSGGVVTAISGTAAIKYNQEFTATLGQTTFTPSVGYISDLIDVFYNGTKLSETDYTATNGSTIVLSQGADLAGDIIEVAIYNPVSGVSNNTLRQQTTFTASAAQTTFAVNYTPGLLDVYFNGSRLSNEEYTANNGTSIILSEAATGGEIIDIFVYSYQVGAFSGIGGQGQAGQFAYFSSQNGISGSSIISISGSSIIAGGNIIPLQSGSSDLGSLEKPFRHIYVGTGSIYLVDNTGQVTNTITAQTIVTTDTLNSGSIDLTKSLPTGTVSGSSQIVGILTSLNSATASFTPRITNLETKSASVDITISSINSKTGSYATTGSNTFFGTQTYSGSVYIANDLIVQGSSSIQYISASSVSIGTNIVQLNTANPSVRFAGLTIIDSGSVGGSGSFLYDSVHDEFIFVHRGNGTNITSSHFVLGPETYDNLGNELYLTCNILSKGTGKEHLVDSCIFDNGTTTCIKNNLVGTGTITGTTIYGSTAVCSAVGKFSTCIDAGTGTFSAATQDAIQTVVRMGGNNASSQLKALDFKLTAGTPLWTISTAAVGTDAGINIMPNGNAGLSLTYAGAASFACSVGIGTTLAVTGTTSLSCRLSIGASDQYYASIFVGGATTCGTSQYAIMVDPQLTGTDNYALFANARIKANTAVTNSFGVYIPSAEKLSGATITNNYALYIANQTSGATLNYSIYSSGGANYFGGCVGIGTTSPAAALNVSCVPSSYFGIIETTGTSAGTVKHFRVHKPGYVEYGIGILDTNSFHISTASTFPTAASGFTLTSAGNVGIGTTGPSAKLHVYSNTSCTTAPTMFLHQFDGNGQGYGQIVSVDKNHGIIMRGTPTSYLNFGVVAGDQMSFLEYGDDFRFYRKTDANDMQLQVQFSGGVIYARNTNVQSLSDIRTKENIRNSEEGLNIITCLRPVRFDFKEGYSDGKKNQLGFIAQEVEEIFPDAVSTMKTDNENESSLKTMGPGALIPVLVKAIQEQQCTIQCLTNRIEQLENK